LRRKTDERLPANGRRRRMTSKYGPAVIPTTLSPKAFAHQLRHGYSPYLAIKTLLR
jgi:hypothetical protein